MFGVIVADQLFQAFEGQTFGMDLIQQPPQFSGKAHRLFRAGSLTAASAAQFQHQLRQQQLAAQGRHGGDQLEGFAVGDLQLFLVGVT